MRSKHPVCVLAVLLLLAAPAAAEDPARVLLPDDPQAVVLSWGQAAPGQSRTPSPFLAIRGNGTAQLRGREAAGEPLSEQEVQELLSFVVREQRLLEVDAKGLRAAMADAQQAGDLKLLPSVHECVLRIRTATEQREFRVPGLYLAATQLPDHAELQQLLAVRDRLSLVSRELTSRDREARFVGTWTPEQREGARRIAAHLRSELEGRQDVEAGAVFPFSHPILAKRLPELRFFAVETIMRETGSYVQFGRTRQQVVHRHAYRLGVLDTVSDRPRVYDGGKAFVDAWRDFGLVATTLEEAHALFFLHRLLGRLVSGAVEPGPGVCWAYEPPALWKRLKVRPADYAALDLPLRMVEGRRHFHCARWMLRAGDWNIPLHLQYRIVSFVKGEAEFERVRETVREPEFPEGTGLDDESVTRTVEGYLAELAAD